MKKENPSIIAVHLFNDYSGSPRILSQFLAHAQRNGRDIELHTSKTEGILDEVQGIRRRSFSYRPQGNKLFTLMAFLRVNWLLFWRLRKAPPNSIVYVNTLLPFGAVLGAKVAGVPVLCHVHEVSVRPMILNSFLCRIANRYTDRLIYVSAFVQSALGLTKAPAVVIPNALSPEFKKGIKTVSKQRDEPFRVLMLGSVKAYKGLHQFVDLAESLPKTDFDLVLNGTDSDIQLFFAGRSLPSNLNIYPRQTDVHRFYARADMVLNLSLPEAWQETFGMTALEAMAYGKPVIVPPVGGIAELVEGGKSGFHCDPRDTEEIKRKITWLMEQPCCYAKMSRHALRRSGDFKFEEFAFSIDANLEDLSRKMNPILGQINQAGMSNAVKCG